MLTPFILHGVAMDGAGQGLDHWISVKCCEDAILRFTAHFDAGQYREMERYFSVDGIWKRRDGDIEGIEQLRVQMAKRKPDRVMRHVISNVRTTLHSADHATVDSYVTLYMHVYGDQPAPVQAPLGGPVVVGRYKDEMRRIDGCWKIQVRQPVHDFKADT